MLQFAQDLYYLEKAMLKSMLVNKNIQKELMIGWQHSCQPIKSFFLILVNQ